MKENYKFKSFEDDIDSRTTGKLFYRFVAIFFVICVLVICSSWAFCSRYQFVNVSGVSMQNTINKNVDMNAQDRSKTIHDGVFIRLTQDIDYGDIVILDRPDEGDNSIIKRALAFEGDYISVVEIDDEFRLLRIKNGTQNVEIIYEDYVKSYDEWSDRKTTYYYDGVNYEKDFYYKYYRSGYEIYQFSVNGVGDNVVFFKVPPHNLFFMGDNRAWSYDARELGTYDTSRIAGRVVDIIKDASPSKSPLWWLNRTFGFFRVCWQDILAFFGAEG